MSKVYNFGSTHEAQTDSTRQRVVRENRYTAQDAIRDLVRWQSEGREFYISLFKVRQQRRLLYHINHPGTESIITEFSTKRPVVGVIDMILDWIREGIDFEIRMLERKRSDRLPTPTTPLRTPDRCA
ncbi:MAG: hypothetical protein KDB07_10065 [Planctomycetes bacterium]|nr:hypothetical protein [Planctomycetota bacterium]